MYHQASLDQPQMLFPEFRVRKTKSVRRAHDQSLDAKKSFDLTPVHNELSQLRIPPRVVS
jgi:hypothetical protein